MLKDLLAGCEAYTDSSSSTATIDSSGRASQSGFQFAPFAHQSTQGGVIRTYPSCIGSSKGKFLTPHGTGQVALLFLLRHFVDTS